MSRPCQCDKVHLGQPWSADQCLVCWYWHHSLFHRQHWNGTIPVPAAPKLQRIFVAERKHNLCVYRGLPTGEVRDCNTCGGKKSIPLVQCAIHGSCTVENRLQNSTAWCATCLQHQPILEELPFNGPPRAYNAGLINWQGRLLLAYRHDLARSFTARVGLAEISRDLRHARPLHDIPIHLGFVSYEDPRFFVYRGQLHIAVVASLPTRPISYLGRMITVRLDDALQPVVARSHDSPLGVPIDKNWIFFERNEKLYATYSLDAGRHRVLDFTSEGPRIRYTTNYRAVGCPPGGVMRGGTNVLLHSDGLLYGMAHIWTPDWTYYLTAYALEAQPPFRLVRLSRQPLYRGRPDRYSDGRSRAVIFPCGLVRQETGWLISAGENDRCVRLFSLSDTALAANLEDVAL